LKLATNNLLNKPTKFAVLLDFGRYSNTFDYLDGKYLGVEIGDIVSVILKGRLLRGLVVQKSFVKENIHDGKNFKYLFIEEINEKKVFESWWRDWLEDLASFYKVNNLKMFKTAFPPGWITQSNKNNQKSLFNIWISKTKKLNNLTESLNEKQLSLMQKLDLEEGIWQSELIKYGFSASLINTLVKKGLLIKSSRQKIKNTPLNSYKENFAIKTIPILTVEQENAISQIEQMEKSEVLLLWGETGSGKTEVYLRIVQSQLEINKSCLIMAPEIGLIPQLIDRFTNRFKKNILEYHSNCSIKQRQLVWRRLLEANEPIILIGTRSAVFLPIKDLGMIIIDEEHDNSYKQETPMPCYDAREVALDRVKRIGSKLVFGSATPSLSMWKKVNFENKFKMIRMQKRISKTKIPEIRIIDMRDEFKKGNTTILSKELFNSLSKLRDKEEQAIILIPRRGYNGFLSCRNCGFIVNCPNCDIALTVHAGSKGNKWLSCHWCNFKRTFINVCPDCNSNAFKPFGIGTQRVFEFLKKELPQLRLLRFDRDTTTGKDSHRNILSDFSKGKADVIIGTQMLAKGIDIPNVTLSVVLAADGLLHRPDISSEEKSLQLFLQLAGRAGRADKNGEVIFQTYRPKHPVISYLKNRDYEGFLTANLKLRKDSNLFPFCKVSLLKISGTDNKLVESVSNKLADYLKPLFLQQNWNLIGPAPSMISKIGNKFRWQILIYGPDNSESPLPENEVLWKIIPRNIFLTIDINPIEI